MEKNKLAIKSQSPIKKKKTVTLLFSGGRDSSLACCVLANRGCKIHLLTFNNGATIQLDLADQRYEELNEKFSDAILQRKLIPSYSLFKEIALKNLEEDFEKYETNLICMGCKLAMHVISLIYCLENKIPVIADGYTDYQKQWIEQMPEAIESVRKFHSEYNIKYINPVYSENSKEQVKEKLLGFGLSTESLEGKCLFGGTFSIPDPQVVVSYIDDKLPFCRDYIKTHFEEKNNKIPLETVKLVNNKRIIFVSHCIVNQCARAKGIKTQLDGKVIVKPILDLIIKHNIGMIQLPCPEIKYEGLNRNACGQNRYNNPLFIEICRKYAKTIKKRIQQYRHSGYSIVGFVGIEYSPTCGISLTTLDKGKIVHEPGFLYKEIMTTLKEEIPPQNYIGISLKTGNEINDAVTRLEEIIEKLDK